MANIFIHFEPTGHSLRHNAKIEADKRDVHKKYRDALNRGVSGHENDHDGGLPVYIIPGTPEESHWKAQHPSGEVCYVFLHVLLAHKFKAMTYPVPPFTNDSKEIQAKVVLDGFYSCAHGRSRGRCRRA